MCVFERGRVQWDEDIQANGRAAIETLVRMGMGLGRAAVPSNAEHAEPTERRGSATPGSTMA